MSKLTVQYLGRRFRVCTSVSLLTQCFGQGMLLLPLFKLAGQRTFVKALFTKTFFHEKDFIQVYFLPKS